MSILALLVVLPVSVFVALAGLTASCRVARAHLEVGTKGKSSRDREDRAIVASVIDLAHAFGLTTVAEGRRDPRAAGRAAGPRLRAGTGLPLEPAAPGRRSRGVAAPARRRHPARALRRARRRPEASTTAAPAGASPSDAVCSWSTTIAATARSSASSSRAGPTTGWSAKPRTGGKRSPWPAALAPDIILLDLAMPGMRDLEALPLLLAVVPMAKVVVLSSLEPAYLMKKAGGQGATAFCTKTEEPQAVPLT